MLDLILLIFLAILAIFFSAQAFNIIFRQSIGFVSTEKKVVKKIIADLKIKNNAKVYELGCGRARFLRNLREKYPNANLVGVEYSFLIYTIAWFFNFLTQSKLKLIKKNFFKISLADAEVVYCYLNISLMEKLEEKMKREVKQGTILISYQFRFPNLEPVKILEVEKKKKVYFYKF